MAFVSSAFERKITPLRDEQGAYLFLIEITLITKYLADAEADPHGRRHPGPVYCGPGYYPPDTSQHGTVQ